MPIFLNIILLVLLFLFLRSIYKLFGMVPGATSMKRVLSISKIGTKKKDIIDIILDYLSIIFTRFTTWAGWSFSDTRKAELEQLLKRAGLNETVERFYIKRIAYPLGAIALGYIISLFVNDVPVVAYIFKGTSIFVAVFLFFNPMKELRELIKRQNERLIMEMPRFIRTIRYSPENKAFLHIVLDYLNCAKSGLKYDLTQLAANIQVMGETQALEDFKDKINIPEVREFVTVLLISSGKNVDMNLYFIESKFEEKVTKIVERELKKRPQILDTINEVLMYALALIFIVPIAINTWEGISQMFH